MLQRSFYVFLFKLTFSTSLTFTATGSETIELAPTSDSGTTLHQVHNPSLIKDTLLQPFQGTPRYQPVSTYQSRPGCSNAATGANLWRATSIKTFDRFIPCNPFFCPWQNGQGWDIELSNTALDYIVRCQAVGYMAGEPHPATDPVRCEDFYHGDEGIDTRVLFDPIVTQSGEKTIKLQVRQSWPCEDGGSGTPVQVEATGTADVAPACTTSTGSAPEPFSGTTVKTWEKTCALDGPAPIGAAKVEKTRLEPFSLDRPYQEGTSSPTGQCIINSLARPGWDLYRLTTSLYAGAMKVEFEVDWRAVVAAGRVPLKRGSINQTDGTVWVDCNRAVNNRPCRFKFDSGARLFTLNRVTKCDDIDGMHP